MPLGSAELVALRLSGLRTLSGNMFSKVLPVVIFMQHLNTLKWL